MSGVGIVVRRLLTVCAVAVLVCTAGIQANERRFVEAIHAGPAISAPAWPDGLKPPHVQGARTLRALVAADIDHDGDTDVVGIDGSFDLVVWVNDGTGQLTPKHSERSDRWQTDLPGPAVNDQLDSTETFAQNDPPSARVDGRFYPNGPAPSHSLVVSPGRAPRIELVSSRTPRAPPVPSFFRAA